MHAYKGYLPLKSNVMRILFIVLFWTALGSTGMASVGDVYFCDEIQHMILNREDSSPVSYTHLTLPTRS